jgi:hypothetical protein
MDGIQIDDGVDSSQGPVLPGFHHSPYFVRDGANRGGGYVDAVQLVQGFLNIAPSSISKVNTMRQSYPHEQAHNPVSSLLNL